MSDPGGGADNRGGAANVGTEGTEGVRAQLLPSARFCSEPKTALKVESVFQKGSGMSQEEVGGLWKGCPVLLE